MQPKQKNCFVLSVLPRFVPTIDLEADEYTHDDHQYFNNYYEPVLSGNGLSQSAQDHA